MIGNLVEGAPGGSGSYQGGGIGGAQSRVNGPAIGLMITAGFIAFFGLLGLLFNLLGIGMGGMAGGDDRLAQMFSGAVGMGVNLCQLILAVVVFMGAQKMKRLENWGFSMASAIIAMLPCGPCCVLGLPIGIWALVVLLNQDVKAAFR